jgi:hypothetical protein
VELSEDQSPQHYLKAIKEAINPVKTKLILIFADNLSAKMKPIKEFLSDNNKPCIFIGIEQENYTNEMA